MSIVVTCRCGQKFAAQEHLAGKQVSCPICGQSILVPQRRAVTSPGPQRSCCGSENPCQLPLWPPVPGRTASGGAASNLPRLRTAASDLGRCRACRDSRTGRRLGLRSVVLRCGCHGVAGAGVPARLGYEITADRDRRSGRSPSIRGRSSWAAWSSPSRCSCSAWALVASTPSAGLVRSCWRLRLAGVHFDGRRILGPTAQRGVQPAGERTSSDAGAGSFDAGRRYQAGRRP